MVYRRYRRRRPYRRRYRRNPFRRKVSRQMRQLDTNRMILNSPTRIVSLAMAAQNISSITGATATKVFIVNPLISLIGTLDGTTVKRDTTFTAFANLFDEFKLNAIRVKIQVLSTPTASTSTATGATFIRSAVDLNGFDSSANTFKGVEGPGLSTADGSEFANFLQTYSSYNQQTVNNNALYPFWKTFYPRGSARGQWIGCSTKLPNTNINNPDQDYPFKPIIMWQVVTPISSLGGAAGACMISIDIDYDVTFKGQRRPTATE